MLLDLIAGSHMACAILVLPVMFIADALFDSSLATNLAVLVLTAPTANLMIGR